MLSLGYMLLHTHSSHSGLSHFLAEHLGGFGEFLDSVVLHGLLDTAKIIVFLFLTYLFMEFIEHSASDKVERVMRSSGKFGPLIGGVFGAFPQCGFSAVAANLYTGRVITLGTLIAVFLSTSDEMIAVLLAGNMGLTRILSIVGYKVVVGILMGFAIDVVLKLMHRTKEEINIDELCDNDNCHCERGVIYSALHHTVTTGLFILITTLLINCALFFIGSENLSNVIVNVPVLSHFISALLGLIPNCAVSVALSQLALSGIITTGTMLSGLFSGAGVGLLVLAKVNKNWRENVVVIALLVVFGTAFGAIAELLPFV